ncbi:discoidin domain-containing protein [Chryseolinea sp. T2]|uniref:PKD domain-containing protein n=1 Tax=Chryseolinea sp. T2 TaxID=3129255 RepID=UPI003076F2E0
MKYIFTILALACCCSLQAQNYFVGGPGSSDNNPGTAAAPFATINKAATVAVAGTTVYIRGGTYRETITPANNGSSGQPITFRPAAGETVIISGLKVIPNSGWSNTGTPNSNIYKTALQLPVNGFSPLGISTNTDILANQLFKDGDMQIEARWPDGVKTKDDLWNMTTGTSNPNGDGSQINHNLANSGWRHFSLFGTAGTTNGGRTFTPTRIQDIGAASITAGFTSTIAGATIVTQGWFIRESRTINLYDPATGLIGWDQGVWGDNINDQQIRRYYYLTGQLQFLTQEREFHYDGTYLYYWQPGGGAPTGTIEYKERNWGFDLRNRSYIQLLGLTFVGCEPATGNTSTTYCTLDNIRASYMNHNVTHRDFKFQGYGMSQHMGTKLLGTNNVVKNSEFQWSASAAVWIGANGTVQNNLFHHISYDGMWGAPVQFWGDDNVWNIKVLNNTMYTLGRGGIDNGYAFVQDQVKNTTNNEIAYNNIYDFARLNHDGGAFYSWGYQNLSGTRIHHNWIHDLVSFRPPVGTPAEGGPYFDKKTPENPDGCDCWKGWTKLTDGIMAGIYFDMGSGATVGEPPLVVDHNVFWNMGNDDDGIVEQSDMEGTEVSDLYELPSFKYSTKQPTRIYNNTFYGATKSYTTYQQNVQSVFRNNISRKELNFAWVGTNAQKNIQYALMETDQDYIQAAQSPALNSYEGVSAQLAGGPLSSPSTYFQLTSTSPAKDHGVALAGYNDADVNPKDIGAYYYGQAGWTAGYVPVQLQNLAPTVNVGQDKTINLPTNSVVINGTASDPDGTIVTYAWTKQSGPAATLTNANTANLTAASLVAGTYVFRLTVTDNGGLTAQDDVTVTVNAAQVNIALNKPATASSLEAAQYGAGLAVDGNAGTRWSSLFADPQWIYVDLQAAYTIQRVKITWDVAYAKNYTIDVANATNGPWTTITTVTDNPSMINDLSNINSSVSGRYIRMNGTARGTNWGYSIYEFEVNGTAANTAPTANAGADKNVSTNSVVVNGSGTDTDGTISSYAWTLISGPNTPSLTGATTANLTINNMINGTYVYRLTVTDNGGLTGTDDVSITYSTNIALNKPTVVSSTESSQYLSSYAVDGNLGTRWSSAFSDPQWLYVDLQAIYNINRVKITWDVAYASSYAIEVANVTTGTWTNVTTISGNTTMINDLTGLSGAGRYIRMRGLTRATNWGYSFFEFEVYGTLVPNVAPTANAGPDKDNYTNSVVVNGSGSDTDGTISTYSWTWISGPNNPTLTNANTANLTISGMTAGTYVYRLTVTDNGGLTGSDDVTINFLTNLALNKNTSVSSTESSSYLGNYAVDGNGGTRWSSAFSDAQWLYVDLLSTYTIKRVKITWDVAYASSFKIQVATTPGTWTDVTSVSGNTSMLTDLTGLSGVGRYIRVQGLTRATNWGYSFFELEVYGTAYTGGRMAMPQEEMMQQPAKETPTSFNVSPNPSNGSTVFNVELESVPGELKIIDGLGRALLQREITEQRIQIPAKGFAPGLYFFMYQTEKGTELKRVMIDQ